ncbi:hypothetical protein LJC02_03915, partial [Breznakia sp. OttesenSCG-928-G09]|nr:hypothetical protein [Breznakia sp. OttesenSCG-928-G09]
MKKREINKQKQKLKKESNIKWIKRAKNMCVALVVLFLVYVFGFSVVLKESFSKVITEYPIIIVGFIVAVANLFVWATLKRFIKMLETYEHIEFVQVSLIIITIAQVLLVNFISVVLLIVSLVKCFNWQVFDKKVAFQKIKEEKLLLPLLGMCVILAILVTLA